MNYTLNRLFQENEISSNMYYLLSKAINLGGDLTQDKNDLTEFLNDLPSRLKIKTVMYIYKDAYSTIHFLNNSSDSFISWICPLLDQSYHQADEILYYQGDIINQIYF
jgi:hypothetical protein